MGETVLDQDHQLALQLQKEQLVIVVFVPRPPPFHSLGSFQGMWLYSKYWMPMGRSVCSAAIWHNAEGEVLHQSLQLVTSDVYKKLLSR